MINIELNSNDTWALQDLLRKISSTNKNFNDFTFLLDEAMVNQADSDGNYETDGSYATDSYLNIYFPCVITLCDKNNNPVNSVDKAEDWFWDYFKSFKKKHRKETILSLSEFSKIMEDYGKL